MSEHARISDTRCELDHSTPLGFVERVRASYAPQHLRPGSGQQDERLSCPNRYRSNEVHGKPPCSPLYPAGLQVRAIPLITIQSTTQEYTDRTSGAKARRGKFDVVLVLARRHAARQARRHAHRSQSISPGPRSHPPWTLPRQEPAANRKRPSHLDGYCTTRAAEAPNSGRRPRSTEIGLNRAHLPCNKRLRKTHRLNPTK